MEFTIEVNGKIYDISNIVKSITYADNLNNGCSKLEFSFVSVDFEITNGSKVKFKYDGENIFYGIVFKVEKTSNKEISVIAYDQLRYAKAKDYLLRKGYTATSIVNKMCNHLRLNKGKIADTNYVLSTKAHNGDSWLDIVYDAISDTMTSKGELYCLRDEFGSITLTNIKDLTIDLEIGDKSLCYDYNYEKSIDENFYNLILILAKGEKAQFVTKSNENSISKYGVMQYYETMDNANVSMANAKASILLDLYNREAETLTIDCLGISKVRAGTSFYLNIADINLKKWFFVKSVTHNYLPLHTMSVEVSI
jgi:hypothetical protein